jgi:hypothetical protein
MAKPLPTVLTMAQIQLIDRVDRYMRYEPRHTRVNVVDFYTAWLACRVGALEELSNAGFGSQVTELVYNWCLGLQARGGDPTTTLLSWNTMYGMAVADNTPDRLAHAECMRKVKLERYGALRSLVRSCTLVRRSRRLWRGRTKRSRRRRLKTRGRRWRRYSVGSFLQIKYQKFLREYAHHIGSFDVHTVPCHDAYVR